jgi:hypothetical protein
MTEDIGSDAHRRPPSQEIEVAVIKERLREAGRRDELLLRSNDEVKTAVHEIKLMLVKGEGRMAALETSQDDTTTRILTLENDKKGPVAIILATLSALGAGIAAYFGFGK